jgi:hypothetical protein
VVVLGKDGFDLMGAWSVAEVMEQREELQRALFVVGKMLDVRGLSSARKHAECVLEARVLRTGEDQIVEPQLSAVSQPLEERMVNHRQIFADLDRPGTGDTDRFHKLEIRN